MWQLLALYNGSWVNILPKSNNISWNYDNESSTELTFDSMYNIPDGTLISLMKDNIELIRGVNIKQNEKRYTYSYNILDYMWYFNKNEEVIQFNNVNAKKAIEQLCARIDVKSNIASIGVNITKIYKDQTITSIIDDILEMALNETGIKYTKYMDINTFTISKLELLKVNCTIKVGSDLSGSSTIEDMKNSVIVVSSEGENANIVATVKDESNINHYGRLQEVISVDDKNISQANQIANNFLKANNKKKKEFTFSAIALDNGENIKSNRLIELNIKERDLVGWYKVKSVSHSLSNSLHKLNITIEV